MWEIGSQPITKTYTSGVFSRSFLLTLGCCLVSFIVPLLLLVSVGFASTSYEEQLMTPSLTYENHQISCLLDDDSYIYDSTFTNQITTLNYQSFLSVATAENNVQVNARIVPTNVVACTFLIYFKINIQDKMESINVVPLHFEASTTSQISAVVQRGIIHTRTSSPVSSSYINPAANTNYFSNDTQILNMADTLREFNIKKNISLFVEIDSNEVTVSSASSSISFLGQYRYPAQIVLAERSLLTNIRSFVPFYIYLFILLWFVIAKPTVRWMLKNRIYSAKSYKTKVKMQ